MIAYTKLHHNKLQKNPLYINVLFVYYLTSLANTHIINITKTRKRIG